MMNDFNISEMHLNLKLNKQNEVYVSASEEHSDLPQLKRLANIKDKGDNVLWMLKSWSNSKKK